LVVWIRWPLLNKNEVDELLKKAESLSGVRLVIALCRYDAQGIKKMRDLSDLIKQRAPDAVIVLGMKDEETKKAFLLAAAGPEAILKKMNSSEIIREIAPLIEGRGGGKPDLAQAGGTRLEKLDDALSRAKDVITKKLSE
jgi:alanyl-tRNA synthetase